VHCKNIIFDFNGVLLWDSHLHEEVWKQFALKLRGSPLTSEEVFEHFQGRTNAACFEYIFGRKVLGQELKELISEREILFKTLCLEMKSNFRLSPGSEELLNFLKENKIPHTIATSAEKSNVEFFFKHLNLNKWFSMDRIVYDDGKIRSKPAPDIYLLASKILNANPSDCVVIEDAKSGIAAAKNAKIGTIIAIAPKQDHSKFRNLPGVTTVISQLGELLQMIEV
jgi:beta-phosphoglucomutase-like phosphatase (HAD superfamily)